MIEKTALGDFWRGYMAGSKLQLYKYEPSKKKTFINCTYLTLLHI